MNGVCRENYRPLQHYRSAKKLIAPVLLVKAEQSGLPVAMEPLERSLVMVATMVGVEIRGRANLTGVDPHLILVLIPILVIAITALFMPIEMGHTPALMEQHTRDESVK